MRKKICFNIFFVLTLLCSVLFSACNEEVFSHVIMVKAYNIRICNVSGSGTYTTGETVNISTTAKKNLDGNTYTFMFWLKNNEIVSYNSTFSFVAGINTEGEYVSVFKEKNEELLSVNNFCFEDKTNSNINNIISFKISMSNDRDFLKDVFSSHLLIDKELENFNKNIDSANATDENPRSRGVKFENFTTPDFKEETDFSIFDNINKKMFIFAKSKIVYCLITIEYEFNKGDGTSESRLISTFLEIDLNDTEKPLLDLTPEDKTDDINMITETKTKDGSTVLTANFNSLPQNGNNKYIRKIVSANDNNFINFNISFLINKKVEATKP
ncbi:MAG: hypothetical protein RR140_01185 [Clostridia bacterium]